MDIWYNKKGDIVTKNSKSIIHPFIVKGRQLESVCSFLPNLVNAEFFESLSIEMMDKLWKHDENVVCIQVGICSQVGWQYENVG